MVSEVVKAAWDIFLQDACLNHKRSAEKTDVPDAIAKAVGGRLKYFSGDAQELVGAHVVKRNADVAALGWGFEVSVHLSDRQG